MRNRVNDELLAKRWRLALLMILLVACIWAGKHGGGGDFFVLRSSVMAAWQGNLTQVYLRETSGPYFYPPFSLVFFGIFSLVANEGVAIVINVLFHTLSYLGLWWGLARFFPNLFKANHFWAWFFCFCFSIAPLHLDFMGQNINLPLAAFAVLAEAFRQRRGKRNEFFCGFLSALIAWVKVFPAFLTVTYFIRGSRELRWGVFTGGIMGLLLPFVVFGRGALFLYHEFFDILNIYHDKNGIAANAALNLPGWVARWSLAILPKSIAMSLTLVLPILVALLFFIWLLRMSEKQAQTRNLSLWAVSMGLTVFLNSASRPDYFMFYVPLFASIAVHWKELVIREKMMLGAAFCFIALTQQAMVGRELNIDLQHLRIPVIGMALLFIAQVSFMVRTSNQRDS